MPFSSKQRGVARGAASAAVISAGALWIAIHFNPFAFPDLLALQPRLSIALQADLIVMLFLMLAIGRLANHRFSAPEDIDGAGLTIGSARATLLQALLQNTLEQAVLAIVIYLAWATLLPSSWLSALPVAVLLFSLGRIAFFATYERGAAARAFGFGLTFYPTVALLLILIIRSLWSMGCA
jgi:hypothetical protein